MAGLIRVDGEREGDAAGSFAARVKGTDAAAVIRENAVITLRGFMMFFGVRQCTDWISQVKGWT